MAKFKGAKRSFVTTRAAAVDLTAASVDVATGMLCPADGAIVVSVAITTQTAGVGTGTHQLLLEHGLAAAGATMTDRIDIDADSAAGTIVTGLGLPTDTFSFIPAEGTVMQIKNVESGTISTGTIVDISVLWQL